MCVDVSLLVFEECLFIHISSCVHSDCAVYLGADIDCYHSVLLLLLFLFDMLLCDLRKEKEQVCRVCV